jgi:formylglycine-generating enzyme required for sulfatase activity
VENLASEYVSQNHNGDPSLTAGYYWTPGDYASGATKDYSNETETREVAWYPGMVGGDELKAVAGKVKNQLGIYDMSGNAWEWCFSLGSGANRLMRGGSWSRTTNYLQVGSWGANGSPIGDSDSTSFRLVKTQ